MSVFRNVLHSAATLSRNLANIRKTSASIQSILALCSAVDVKFDRPGQAWLLQRTDRAAASDTSLDTHKTGTCIQQHAGGAILVHETIILTCSTAATVSCCTLQHAPACLPAAAQGPRSCVERCKWCLMTCRATAIADHVHCCGKMLITNSGCIGELHSRGTSTQCSEKHENVLNVRPWMFGGMGRLLPCTCRCSSLGTLPWCPTLHAFCRTADTSCNIHNVCTTTITRTGNVPQPPWHTLSAVAGTQERRSLLDRA